MTPASIHPLANGVRLHYAEQGDPGGMPVVMLHGITDSWRSFESVMAHLPATLRVFALSQRGHGESDRPGRYRTRDFAGDAAAFIEALGLGPALVVGHSMGSVNAMRLAIDRPDLLRGLVTAGAFASFQRQGRAGRVQSQRHRAAARPDRPGLRGRVAAKHAGATGAAGVLRHGRARVPAGSRRSSGATRSPRCSTTTSLPRSTASSCRPSSSGAIATRCARPATRSGSSGRSRARACSPTRARGTRCTGKSLHVLPTTLRASPSTLASPTLLQGDIPMTTMTDDAAVAAKAAPRRGTRAALVDARGCPVSTGSARAIEHAEKALWRMLSYYGNALDDLDAAIAEDPTWALAHLMKANVLLSMTEHGLGLMAADSLQRAAELAAAGQANDRERRHVAATQACAAGQWQQACEAWERILLDAPAGSGGAADRAPVRLLPRRRPQPASARRPRAARMVAASAACTASCSACTPSASRRATCTRMRSTPARRRSRSMRATRGPCTR